MRGKRAKTERLGWLLYRGLRPVSPIGFHDVETIWRSPQGGSSFAKCVREGAREACNLDRLGWLLYRGLHPVRRFGFHDLETIWSERGDPPGAPGPLLVTK